jgi:hypothetical protein
MLDIPCGFDVQPTDSNEKKYRWTEDELKLFGPKWYKLSSQELENTLCGTVFENELVNITPVYY